MPDETIFEKLSKDDEMLYVARAHAEKLMVRKVAIEREIELNNELIYFLNRKIDVNSL